MKQKQKQNKSDVFDELADILGFLPPEIDPSSGYKVVTGTIQNCKLEITCSAANIATQTTIKISDLVKDSFTFDVLGGAWFEKGGLVTQNKLFDAHVCCRSNEPERLLDILNDEAIRLCVQSLGDCSFQLRDSELTFFEQLDMSEALFSKYMVVVSIMVLIVRAAKLLGPPQAA